MALSDADKNLLKQAAEILTRELVKDGDKVAVYKFGTFKRKDYPARKARNPKTGESVEVPARSAIRFSASKSAKTAV